MFNKIFPNIDLKIQLEFVPTTFIEKFKQLYVENYDNIEIILQKTPYIMPKEHHIAMYLLKVKDLCFSLKKDKEGICHVLIYFRKNKKGESEREKVVDYLKSKKFKKFNKYHKFVRNFIKKYELVEDAGKNWIGINIHFAGNKSKIAEITIGALNSFNKKPINNSPIFIAHAEYDEKRED